jgi:hypothetical protein
MTEVTVNIAKAKKHFSELLGQVAFGKKHILCKGFYGVWGVKTALRT